MYEIMPVILAKNARVIERPDLQDAADIDDIITDLWKDGVDAVWIGDKTAGEQELCVINPRAIVNIDNPDFYKVYRLGGPNNPLRVIDDAGIKKLYNDAKAYIEVLKSEPAKPKLPSLNNEDGSPKSHDAYKQEYDEYRKRLQEAKSTDEYKQWLSDKRNAGNEIRFP